MKSDHHTCIVNSSSRVAPYFVLLITMTILTPLHAADWLDDFSDGNVIDGSPVTWFTDPGGFFPGEYSAELGGFNFVPLDGDTEDQITIAWVDSEIFHDTGSVRTLARVYTEPAEVFTGQGNVGPLLFFDPTVLTGYLGVIDAGGGLFLNVATGGGESIELATGRVEFNATEDVFVQLDHDGQFLSMTVWPAGEAQPDTAQIVVEDDTFLSGRAGLIFIEDNFMDAAVFSMAQASTNRIIDGQSVRGDFNGDGTINRVDIDALMNEVAAATNGASFDLNKDGSVNDSDRDEWLSLAGPANGLAGPYLVGDANLDGTVDAIDLNAVGLTWQTANADWTKGNFTGAGTDAADLNAIGLKWQQSVPAAAQSVPEPPAPVSLLLLLGLHFLRGKRW